MLTQLPFYKLTRSHSIPGQSLWSVWKLRWEYQERFHHQKQRSCGQWPWVWKQLESVACLLQCKYINKSLQSVLTQEGMGIKTLQHYPKWGICWLPWKGKIRITALWLYASAKRGSFRVYAFLFRLITMTFTYKLVPLTSKQFIFESKAVFTTAHLTKYTAMKYTAIQCTYICSALRRWLVLSQMEHLR